MARNVGNGRHKRTLAFGAGRAASGRSVRGMRGPRAVCSAAAASSRMHFASTICALRMGGISMMRLTSPVRFHGPETTPGGMWPAWWWSVEVPQPVAALGATLVSRSGRLHGHMCEHADFGKKSVYMSYHMWKVPHMSVSWRLAEL